MMATLLRSVRETSQADTSAPAALAQASSWESAIVGALPPAEAPRDRRGPMRPAALSPTRSRLTGWMLGAIFRIGDAIGLGVLAVAAAPLSAGHIAPSSLTPFIVGALALIWSLSTTHAYAFTQR